MAPEQLRIDANGMSFSALAWGDPDAPLALLVHGYPDTAHTWRHLGPVLAEHGWRAVAPFTRGYGPTDLAKDDSYLVKDLATDLLALHDALGGDDRAVLIGHDWGAITVWEVSATAPGRFAKLVAMAVPPTGVVIKPFTRRKTLGLGARQSRLSWYLLYNQIPGGERGLDRVIPKLWRDWSPGYDATQDVAHVFSALQAPGRRRAALRYYRNNLQRGIVPLVRVEPRQPALYLHGAQDGCMQAEIIEAFPNELPPGSRYERIEGVGHFMQLENPGLINGMVLDWIGSH